MSTTKPQPTEQERVEDWREETLRKAGYPADDAIELSRRPDVDIHRAAALLENGCSRELAVEILR